MVLQIRRISHLPSDDHNTAVRKRDRFEGFHPVLCVATSPSLPHCAASTKSKIGCCSHCVLSVLPSKIRIFCHLEAEQALKGTWVSLELHKALQKDYTLFMKYGILKRRY
ncbi:hypothetical protein HOLleu_13184 [Holothuria leucospilota]|uniref:Uncharacterized protein n=1 Tax=Holothuria leucospilota TaxID=206669 RepID=A0A9Q1CC54_HOLLE|nr:hypothetical protein HOLleu_13184 [Holothuria leucospilota]